MKRNLLFFLFISFSIHFILFFLFSNYLQLAFSNPISIEIAEEEPQPQKNSSQIVEQNTFNHKTPDKNFYLSQHDNTTVDEYKGKLGQSPNMGFQTPTAVDSENAEDSIVFETSANSLFHNNIDYLEGVHQEGSQNSLNTKEILFYTFYSRVKHQIYWHWIREIQAELAPSSLYTSSLQGRLMTHIEAFLDSKGYLNSIVIKKKSGLNELDRASINAIQKAHPFPNPPQPLISNKGTLKLQHIFVLLNENPNKPSF